MLGKHHLSISILSIIPFMIPLMFLGNPNYISYFVAVLFSVAIGSLMPDTDCKGKSLLYYRFGIIAILMKPVQKFTVWFFNLSKIKTKLKLEYEVDNEHRGIMHSPIGILISSIIITFVLLIILLIIGQFNIVLLLFVLAGLIIGQILHLLEDSCTVSGINWKFPFGEKWLKGKIYTFEKDKEEIDIRPGIYQNILISIMILMIILYSFNYVTINILFVYLILLVVLIICWIIFFKLAKEDSKKWHRNKKELAERRKKMKKTMNQLSQNLERGI